MVLFSFQRLLSVYFPLKQYEIDSKNQSKKYEKVPLLILIIFALVYYTSLWDTGYIERLYIASLWNFSCYDSEMPKNMDESESNVIFRYIKYIYENGLLDISARTCIPFLLILLINILVVCKLNGLKPLKRFFKFRITSKNIFLVILADLGAANLENIPLLQMNPAPFRRHMTLKQRQKRLSQIKKTSKILVILPFIFLILNTSVLIHDTFYHVYSQKVFGGENPLHCSTKIESVMDQVFCYILNNHNVEKNLKKIAHIPFFLNFTINFFLYALKIKMFKKILLEKFLKRRPKYVKYV